MPDASLHRAARMLLRALAPAAAMLLAGCILVRTSEHRVLVREDGSGEGVLRLIDIRSDGENASAVYRDFGTMMQTLEEDGMADFETDGRRVTGKQFEVRGDTLCAEIRYAFPSLQAVEGMQVTMEGFRMIVGEAREVVTTNGRVEDEEHHVCITWPKETRRFVYVIRERHLPVSTSLASYYTRYARP